MSYARESAALDDEILRIVERWHRTGTTLSDGEFDDLALRLFDYQLRYNHPYARYCAGFGVAPGGRVESWESVVPVPAGGFKEATLATFDPSRAELTFQTSGTTASQSGVHYMETRTLYDAALRAGFSRFVVRDGARLRYFNVVPNPSERPRSSLGYMMQQVSLDFGDGVTGWYVRQDALLFDAFVADLRAAIDEGAAACIATTAFGLVALLDEMQRRELSFTLPRSSRIMETGGFKGRTRFVAREELYARAVAAFGVALEDVVAEYGMTELTSQYYDAPGSRGIPQTRRKGAPPWLRTRVVGPDGRTLRSGTAGALVHVDLANRSSCVAIATEDVGVRFDDGLVIVGREAGAELRGCSLDAETLTPL